ncbi:ProQ/FINO family protein [uncultured Caballeronia sp.]|uniref:ProQ/FINO family protein n=1 Tax=uncultured Caballeronia sp. TaxID=1827198 RepID=UPI0035C9AE5E
MHGTTCTGRKEAGTLARSTWTAAARTTAGSRPLKDRTAARRRARCWRRCRIDRSRPGLRHDHAPWWRTACGHWSGRQGGHRGRIVPIRGSRYWSAMSVDAIRVDLSGAEAGRVSPEDAVRAQKLEEARVARVAAKAQATTAAPAEAAPAESAPAAASEPSES